MASPVLELTSTDERLSIGTVEGFGLLLVGESLDFELEFLHFDGVLCKNVATDFTGFAVDAEAVDSAGVVLQAIALTPSAGDATGKFAGHLDPADVTTSLRTNVKKWQFRISDVGNTINKSLIFVTFKVT